MSNARREILSLVRRDRGFTLIEILIVVFIISLILSIAIPNYTRSTGKAQEELCYSNQKMTEAALSLYMLDKKLENLEGLPADHPFQRLVDEGYLKEIPQCPAGGVYSISTEQGEHTVTCDKHDHYRKGDAADKENP